MADRIWALCTYSMFSHKKQTSSHSATLGTYFIPEKGKNDCVTALILEQKADE